MKTRIKFDMKVGSAGDIEIGGVMPVDINNEIVQCTVISMEPTSDEFIYNVTLEAFVDTSIVI